MDERELIKSCLEGSKQSLTTLVKSVQGLVFNLSLRFLWERADAEDATQEILIKVITNLRKFKGNSKFDTWVYRIATNYLINLKTTSLEKKLTSFDIFATDLQTFKGPVEYELPDKSLLEQELKTGCTLAMLQCLDRDLRMAFILGSVLKIKSSIAAKITGVTAENFRKRVELSRKLLGTFLNAHCGVYNTANTCRCSKRINSALKCGQIKREELNFADKVESYNLEMEELDGLAGIYTPDNFNSTKDLLRHLNTILKSKNILK
ncbi:RNA polymerase sigma factor [Fulvivirga ulvae]|uniref:RNA polymerase sigma factor n=1 Tax=Fulvivirga ulvae TaxID=2904245 RepID=UPI001F34E26F|nr:RNA polymerase sigma factor [Fulvivirga ulvae]UII30675.1 RNA polymerase sigma factor [Fulvivirga ulvae]